jgi:hypothetical protein
MVDVARLGAGVGAAALIFGLTACSTGGPDGTPSPAASASLPSIAPTVPDGDSLTDWATTALPEDSAGGDPFVQRTTGVVEAGGAHGPESIGQDAGSWVVQITCLSESGGPLSYDLVVDGAAEAGTVPCAPDSEPGETTVSRLEFDGGAQATLRLSSDERTAFVYQVGQVGSDAD